MGVLFLPIQPRCPSATSLGVTAQLYPNDLGGADYTQ